MNTCSIAGCDSQVLCKDMCGMHYQRSRLGIDMFKPKVIKEITRVYPQRREYRTCSIDGCSKSVWARELCTTHHLEWRLSRNPQCSVDGCDRASRTRGMCQMHYKRVKRNGGPHRLYAFGLEERFRKYVKTMSSGCIEWTGSLSNKGYGVMRIDRKTILVHRLSWQMEFGDIPAGLNVLHKCDNPRCLNTEHLFLGTQKENVHDCMKKGRFKPRGITMPARIL